MSYLLAGSIIGFVNHLPVVSIIILNFNSGGLLKYCLRGIIASPPSGQYEIIVVDNASSDARIPELARAYPEIRFIFLGENRGYAAGNNIGIAASRGEFILILNPDIVVFEQSIDRLIEALRHDETLGVVGPKLLNPDRTLQYSCNRFYSPLTPLYRRTSLGRLPMAQRLLEEDLMIDWDHETPRDVDWLMGSALLVRRKAIAQVGEFDERFFLYFEDMDWCRRFWERGWRVRYVPVSTMVHFHQRLSAQSFWKLPTRIHIASAFRYFAKHGIRRPLRSSRQFTI